MPPNSPPPNTLNFETQPTTTPPIDSSISLSTSRIYWSATPATNNGMLGGYESVTTPDLKHSKRFITQVRRILQSTSKSSPSTNDTNINTIPPSKPPPKITHAVDCGAGIGRITKGLLLKVAETVDVVEPIEKFAVEVEKERARRALHENGNGNTNGDGQIGEIFIEGLETWEPPEGTQYGLIWNQWCLGHLTDVQLVSYLKRAARALTGTNTSTSTVNTTTETTDTTHQEKGWIMVKENLSREVDGDIFDDQDSSVTRTDRNFRRMFEEAGLKVVKAARQEGFPSELYVVMMYALRPS